MMPYESLIEIFVIRVLAAGLFLLAANIGIKYLSKAVREAFSHKYEENTILDLIENSSKGLMWFSAILIGLSLLGFSQIAASLGTAAGFLALGVSLALKSVLSDTVAGVYLAKDPDFNNGDNVEVDGSKGVVQEVGLRKSRIELESGDLRVLNNSDVEKKWTKIKEE